MIRNRYINGLDYELPHPFRREAERLRESYYTDTYKEDGVIRWKSNGRVPPQDILEFWRHVKLRFNMAKSQAARAKDDKAFLQQYRESQRQRQRTPEELSEMRNAFGEGTVVVDVLTGRKTRL